MTGRGPRTAAVGLVLAMSAPVWCGRAPAAQQPHWLGFRGDLGAEVPRGSAADLFQGNIRGEFSLLFQPRPFPPFYFGFGYSWVTFHLEPPYANDCDDATTPIQEPCEPWNNVGLQLFAGAYLGRWLTLPFYVEGRVIERRLRPQNYLYFHIDSDDYVKETPYPEYRGIGVEGVIGLQLPLTGRATRVDIGARIGQFRPVHVVFDPPFANLARVTGGWTVGLQAGLVWFP